MVKIIEMNFGINSLDKLLGLYVILNLKRLNYSMEKLFLDCFHKMRFCYSYFYYTDGQQKYK